MHIVDLIALWVVGERVPGNLLDGVLMALEEVNEVAGFINSLGHHLVARDLPALTEALIDLPALAEDSPELKQFLLDRLEVSEKKLDTLKTVAAGAKLVAIIATELQTLTAPRFDTAVVVAR